MADRRDIRRILRSDLGDDLPAWIDRLLDPLNNLIEEILDEKENGIPLSDLRTQNQTVSAFLVNAGDGITFEKEIFDETIKMIQVISITDENGNRVTDSYTWTQNNTQVKVFFSTLTGGVDVNLLMFY